MSFVGDCHINLENVGAIEGRISRATNNVAPTFCNYSRRTTHNHFDAIALGTSAL